MLKKNVARALTTLFLLATIFPLHMEAGNLKKKYINIAKDGEQATQADLGNIASVYGNISTVFSQITYDFSGKPNHATINAGVKSVEGKVGKAMAFEGIKTKVGAATVQNLPAGNAPRSIGAWIYPTSSGPGMQNGLFGYPYQGYGGGTGTWFEVCYVAGDKFELHMYGLYPLTAKSFPSKQWYHVVATHDGTTAKLYINGNLELSQTVTLNTKVNPTGYNFNLGNSVNPYDPIRDAYLDEVSVWNIALTPEQIKAHMEKPITGNETGLLAYWNMEN